MTAQDTLDDYSKQVDEWRTYSSDKLKKKYPMMPNWMAIMADEKLKSLSHIELIEYLNKQEENNDSN